MKTIKCLIAAIIAGVSLIAAATPASAETVFRYPLGTLVALKTDLPPDLSPADAAHRRPDAFEAPGLSGPLELDLESGVINTLYDRLANRSAANWPVTSAAGSQHISLFWNSPVEADGCVAIANIRGLPGLTGFRFQHRTENGTWTPWTADLGGFDSTRSGNKTYTGDCGIPAGTSITGLRVAPPSHQAGEVWYREFRATYNGASAL